VGGPVFTNPDYAVALLQAAVERARASGRMQLQIKSWLRFPTELVNDLTCAAWRPTYVLEIPNKKEELRFGDARNRHNIKWAVKKAEKHGLQVREAETERDLHAWYPLYLQAMRRNCVPPRPLRLFRAIWRNFRSLGLMCLQLAEQHSGSRKRLVAGSIFLRFNHTLWYAFTGVDDDALSLHPNDLILWNSINDACGTGVRWLDFGEVSEDHPELIRFKTKWGALPKDQYRYYSGNLQPRTTTQPSTCTLSSRVFRKVWQHLPLQITAQLGDLIYSRL
jgi:lipid II:glycine glycyltransferase (peptidoglycan interpeptide bridge formation enzyme)